MKKNTSKSLRLKAACFLMPMALLWLTVSIPFVYECQKSFAQENVDQSARHSGYANDDTSDNPLTTTTEEKNSDNASNLLAEEYLHHAAEEFNYANYRLLSLHPTQEDTYTAFHGELLCPPPNA
jgi:hypothetical protein